MSCNEPTSARRRYRAFGLCIEVDFPLPELELETSTAAADVLVQKGDVRSLLQDDSSAVYRFEDDEAWLSWREVGDFHVLGDDRITYRARPDVGDALLGLPLLGPVMGVLLERRRLLTLHGSAVALAGGVAVFLGDKGAGKSTTAAALLRAGKTLLTDDLVAVDCRETPILYPAYPQVKLTEEASAAIVVDGKVMERPHPEFEKQRMLLDAPFDSSPRSPHSILVLERGEGFALEPLAGAAGLQALMRFSYATRFGSSLIRGRSAADHLRQCAALSRSARVRRLVVPNDLEALKHLPEWLEQNLFEPAEERFA